MTRAAILFLGGLVVLGRVPVAAGQDTIHVGTSVVAPQQDVVIPISLTSTQDLTLLNVDLLFDVSLCDRIDAQSLRKAGRALASPQEGGTFCPTEGRVRLVFLDLTGNAVIPPGSGPIAEWAFTVRADAAAGLFELALSVQQAQNRTIPVLLGSSGGSLTIAVPPTATSTSAPTATRTVVPTATSTLTATARSTATATFTATATLTSTVSPESTETPFAPSTSTSTPVGAATKTPTQGLIATATESPIADATASPTSTATAAVTLTLSPTQVPSETPTTAPVHTPTSTPSDTPVATAPATDTPTPAPPATSTAAATGSPSASVCAGDCNDDGAVTIDELVRMVNIALAEIGLEVCASADGDGDGVVTVNELVQGVLHALNGCPRGTG